MTFLERPFAAESPRETRTYPNEIMEVDAIPQQNERIVRDYVTALWQDHEFDRVTEFVDNAFTYTDPMLSEPVRGPREFREYLRATEAAFPDFHVLPESVVADDDVVLAEWTLTGTHDGPLEGIPPTGRQLILRGMSTVRLEGGKLTTGRTYWDTADGNAQLGLEFPAVVGQLPKLAYRKLTGRR